METPKIFESEYRFCEILWENEPIKSGGLVAICEEKFKWKKSTTYTVLKKLCLRSDNYWMKIKYGVYLLIQNQM